MGSKKLEVVCPCCETKLQIDKKTGEVIWEEKKEKPMPSLSDMVNNLGSQQEEQEKAEQNTYEHSVFKTEEQNE